MKKYKDEDSEIIFEFLKKFDEETEERKKFTNALRRQLLRGYYAEEKLKKIEERKQDESWDSISK